MAMLSHEKVIFWLDIPWQRSQRKLPCAGPLSKSSWDFDMILLHGVFSGRINQDEVFGSR